MIPSTPIADPQAAAAVPAPGPLAAEQPVPAAGEPGTGLGHPDRTPFLKTVPYTCPVPLSRAGEPRHSAGMAAGRGTALALNIGPGGMLLVTNEPLATDQVLRVQVPTGVPGRGTPTLVEVRWTSPLPVEPTGPSHLVGVRFLF